MMREKLQAWWWRKQGLDGSLQGASPAAVLQRSGWARSVGGVGPYLTLFSRGGINRADADGAVASLDIHELPAARGCTYVVPARDYALALTLAHEFGDSEMRVARKLGVTDDEIERLGDAIVQAVVKRGGPMQPDALRDATAGSWRSMGEEGRKKGITTTLPVALGILQTRGRIRRVPVDGRIDQQRYAYAAWEPNPLAAPVSVEGARTELARRFFEWVGPATLAELQWFSGLGARVVKQAVEPLGLVSAGAEDRLLLPGDLESWEDFGPPTDPEYALVSSLDAISATRRDVRGLLGGGDSDREVFVEKNTRPMGGLNDLPSHAILDRGRLIGLWEYDPEAGEIVWALLGGKADQALRDVVERTQSFVRDQLGDARAFSLDSPKSRRPRMDALRKMARGV